MPPVDHIEPGPDTIRILLTTDNHVGYLENDPVRGDDSWKTFQEVTYLAKSHDVDMLVQGGDLFHVTKPLKKSLFHVIQSLRLNCLGDRPCELELLSDPALALRSGETVNYEDPNLNVAVPVFAISGNHDDATGEGMLSPLDVMAATGLVNYFGQIPQSDKIKVTPLLFQKGTSKLALYGINNMRDERLQRIMKNGDVTFQRPKEHSDFFNLMCIHQNHFRHTMTSYVPEDFLPSFLDFVLWGHEHECIPFPQYNPTTGFDTLQAGSTVATSLSEGETAPKHVFLLDIKGKEYLITPIALQSVRPFVMKEISLAKENFVEGPASKADIQTFLTQQVESLIADAKKEHESTGATDIDILPLIRLRVDHTGDYEVENSRRFSNKFVGKIANVNDILLYHKKKASKQESQPKLHEPTVDSDNTLKVSIQQLLKQVLGESNLFLIPEDGMFDVTKKFIEQEDKQIFNDYVDKTIDNAAKALLDVNIDEEEFHVGDEGNVKRSFRQLLNKLRMDSQRKPITEDSTWEEPPARPVKAAPKSKSILLSDDDEDDDFTEKKPKPTRKKTIKQAEINSDSDIEMIDPEPKLRKAARKAPARRKPTKSAEIVSDFSEGDYEAEPEPKAKTRKAPAKRVTKSRATRKKKDDDLGSMLDDILSLAG